MAMDPRLRRYSGSVNGVQLGNPSLTIHTNQNVVVGHRFEDGCIDRDPKRFHPFPTNPMSANVASCSSNITSGSSISQEEDLQEDCDFSDAVLSYINQILMEEDMEEKTCMLQDSLDLQAAEKSFYDVLGKKYPPSPEQNLHFTTQYVETADDTVPGSYVNYLADDYNGAASFVDYSQSQCQGEGVSTRKSNPIHTVSQSSNCSSNSIISSIGGLVDSPGSTQVPESISGSQFVWQFRKGVEEASKFLPSGNELLLNLDVNRLLTKEIKAGSSELVFKVDGKDLGKLSLPESRGKKNPHGEQSDFEGERSSKLAAIFTEAVPRTEPFDLVMLYSAGEGSDRLAALRRELQDAKNKSAMQNGQSKGFSGGKGRGKKRSGKKEVVDLRTLLVHCAQAVAADDHRSATELLRIIRQHSSPFGDGTQRLASCFADGLEARLAGTGSQIYKGLVTKRVSAAHVLKAYHLYLAACPFRKMSNFASNKTILAVAETATRLHVIDFGILYGFQWPTLIQRLSWISGGPPSLRITGIDFPQPGFRPAERVEETGRRLADYAKTFNVNFEYNAVAKSWETVTLEDLKLDRDEVIVVNCSYRAKNLLDESVAVDSVRNIFLKLIRKINPDFFIHGVVNGAYNAPFFVTRFREALFHYSALFDMLETIVPREDRERMLIEKEIFGREALNVIACEGWERVERPETYKQWQARVMRAGFLQVPFERFIVETGRGKVASIYHKDFVIDEDGKWLLMGWKGRIIYGLSAWRPT